MVSCEAVPRSREPACDPQVMRGPAPRSYTLRHVLETRSDR